MNEEQKEQNIPAPVPSENNQNITPVNRWQIKSWQIALVGVIVQVLITISTIIVAVEPIPGDVIDKPYAAFISAASVLFFITLTLLLSGITLLMYYSKTRLIGAILSIIFSMVYFLGVIAGIFATIVLLLLIFYFDKIFKIVRIISIILGGIIGIIIIDDILHGAILLNNLYQIHPSSFSIPGIIFLLAGIYYFRKKV